MRRVERLEWVNTPLVMDDNYEAISLKLLSFTLVKLLETVGSCKRCASATSRNGFMGICERALLFAMRHG